MFGLHENYTPQYIFEYIHDNINLEYTMFEEMIIFKLVLSKEKYDELKTLLTINLLVFKQIRMLYNLFQVVQDTQKFFISTRS